MPFSQPRSLDLATHQLILNSLALNLAEDANNGTLSQQDSDFFRNAAASTSKVKGNDAYLVSGFIQIAERSGSEEDGDGT